MGILADLSFSWSLLKACQITWRESERNGTSRQISVICVISYLGKSRACSVFTRSALRALSVAQVFPAVMLEVSCFKF